jgi:hypothetical protein
MERWHLGCTHDGTDGLQKYGVWFPDEASMVIALLHEIHHGYYTTFTITKGSGPSLITGKRGLAAGAWYPTGPA